MDESTIQKLRGLDEAFYRENAVSFAQTRQHAWPGWNRVVAALPACPSSVLDVACGNARFKTFVDKRFGSSSIRYHGVDSCPEMLPQSERIDFQHLDIIECLMQGTLTASLAAPACDLIACFGFMHHVPTFDLRAVLLDALLDKTAPKGTLAISFWQFADDPKMLEKARAATEAGCAELGLALDEGDYLLGWNENAGTYRYCHSFADSELDELASRSSCRAVLVDRFRADGKSGVMNGYLVFRKS